MLGLPKCEFSTGEKHFTPEKNQEKWLFPSEKYNSYASAFHFSYMPSQQTYTTFHFSYMTSQQTYTTFHFSYMTSLQTYTTFHFSSTLLLRIF